MSKFVAISVVDGPLPFVPDAKFVAVSTVNGGPVVPSPLPPAPLPGPSLPINLLVAPLVTGGFVSIPANPNGTVNVILDPAAAVTGLLTFIVPSLLAGQFGSITITNSSAFAIGSVAFQGSVSGALPSALVAGQSLTLGRNGSSFVQVA